MSDAAPEAAGEWQRLDPRYLRMAKDVAMVRVVIWGVLTGLVAALVWWIATPGTSGTWIVVGVWLLQMIGVGIVWFRRLALWYRHSAWRLDGQFLELRTGVWWRTETRVPRSRIQHTDVGQGPIERRHGLGHLVVYTAGTHHGTVELRGLAHEVALMLRDKLLEGDARAPV